MNLVIEIVGDNGDLMPDDQAERLVRDLLSGVTEETYGCLELTDLDGRAVLAKVSGKATPTNVKMPGNCVMSVVELWENADIP